MISPTSGLYRDPAQGASSSDLVRRALASNGELAAARIDIERARARLRQAGLRPNPTLDFEQTTERLTGSGTDRATSVGVALPLELGNKRGRRVEFARVELEAVETEVADRERRLAGEVATLYAEALPPYASWRSRRASTASTPKWRASFRRASTRARARRSN